MGRHGRTARRGHAPQRQRSERPARRRRVRDLPLRPGPGLHLPGRPRCRARLHRLPRRPPAWPRRPAPPHDPQLRDLPRRRPRASHQGSRATGPPTDPQLSQLPRPARRREPPSGAQPGAVAATSLRRDLYGRRRPGAGRAGEPDRSRQRHVRGLSPQDRLLSRERPRRRPLHRQLHALSRPHAGVRARRDRRQLRALPSGRGRAAHDAERTRRPDVHDVSRRARSHAGSGPSCDRRLSDLSSVHADARARRRRAALPAVPRPARLAEHQARA